MAINKTIDRNLLQGKGSNLTNILSNTATTDTGGVDQKKEEGVISGVYKDVNAPDANAPTTTPTTSATTQSDQRQQTNIATRSPKQPARSGMFTNIKQYVEKNQPSAQNLAGAVGSTVQRSADIAKKGLQASQQQYKSLMDEGTLSNIDAAVGEVKSAAESAAYKKLPKEINNQQNSNIVDDKRLRSILDATYKGPRDLYEIGSYGESINKAAEAERLRNQLDSAMYNTELLEKSLRKPGSRYTKGSQMLDQFILGSSKSQEQLQKIKEDTKNISKYVQNVNKQAKIDALDRAIQAENVRKQARNILESQAKKRSKEVEDYITSQVKSGEALSDYFTNLLSKADGGLDLGSIEAETLGIKSGAGVYNLLSDDSQRENLIKSIDARENLERKRLLSKEQQAQLAELQRIAQLSKDYGTEGSGLGFKSAYQDAELAETQDALAALGLENFGKKLTEAEEKFRQDAGKTVTGTGKGQAKYDKGLWRGRGTIDKTATESSSLKDILKNQGYDFESDPSNYISDANIDLLRNISKLSKGEIVDKPANLLQEGVDFSVNDLLTAGLGSSSLADLATIALVGPIPTVAPSFLRDIGGTLEDTRIFGDIGENIGKLFTGTGNAVDSIIGSNLFGGGKSGAVKKAERIAKEKAMLDLQKRIQDEFKASGFEKRVKVSDTEESNKRQKD